MLPVPLARRAAAAAAAAFAPDRYRGQVKVMLSDQRGGAS
jgi:hypothetical protein